MSYQNDLNMMAGYNHWANQYVLNFARQLSNEQLHAKLAYGFGTVFETLVHLMAAEQVWLARWNGHSPEKLTPASNYADLDQLETDWNTVNANLVAYLGALTPERLDSQVTYKDTQGVEFTNPLSFLVWHLMTHNMEHRAQIAAACTEAGLPVGSFNVIHYLRQL